MIQQKFNNGVKIFLRTNKSSLVSTCTGDSECLLNSASWASIRRLKVQEFLLTSSANSVLSRLPDNDESSFISNLQEKRDNDVELLRQSYLLIKDTLLSLKDKVSSKEKIENLDVSCYKSIIDELENRIDSFRSFVLNEINTLKSSEKRLQLEVDAMKKHFLNFDTMYVDKRSSIDDPLGTAVRRKNIISKPCEEVIQFQNFLKQTGGHTGGWGHEEHNIFLHFMNRIWKRTTEPEDLKKKMYLKQLTNLLTNKIRDLTPDEVTKHDLWYEQYLQLADAQRQVLEKWKALKKISKYQKQIEATNVDNTFYTVTVDGNKHTLNDNAREQIKDRIKDWKEMKKFQNRLLTFEKAELAMKNFETKPSLKLNKNNIEVISEAKKLELETKKLECEIIVLKEREKKALEANKKIKEFRLRDQKYIQLRRAASRKYIVDPSVTSTHQNVSSQKPMRVSLSMCKRKYQKGDHTKPTTQWKLKTGKSSIETIIPYQSCYIEDRPKLAKPEWRKGVVNR